MIPYTHRHNERWVALADITNSTNYMHLICEYTLDKLNDKNRLFFRVTTDWNKAVEAIYRSAELCIPERANLANTMGDGFLLIGTPEHGSDYITQELPSLLVGAVNIKLIADQALSLARKLTEERISNTISKDISLPPVSLRIAVHMGHIVQSMSFNRYIGDCINFTSRLLSSAYQSDDNYNTLILSGKILELIKLKHQEIFKMLDSYVDHQFKVTDYPDKQCEYPCDICRLPIPNVSVNLKSNRLPTYSSIPFRQDPLWIAVYKASKESVSWIPKQSRKRSVKQSH